jgi:hypothetical protein
VRGAEVIEVGRYRVHGAFASGGMATVHIGRLLGSAGFARTVAIKRLHQQFAADPYFVSMLREEARIAGSIRHPNAIPIVDVVATRDELVLVMDYVPGESLSRLAHEAAAKGERIPVPVAVAIVVGVLGGLHAAHQATGEDGAPLGIVHRDVSPQNVLVGADGLARVIDFGIAKARGSVLSTQQGEVKGKLRYMAPEQIDAQPVSPATDVYAASIVLWEAIAGRRLFDAETESAVLAAALRRSIPPLATALDPASLDDAARALLVRLDEVIARGTEKEPAARFASAREMALALARCVTPATPGEVETWMTALAGDLLSRRALLVQAAERGHGLASGPIAGGGSDESTVVSTLVDPPSRTAARRGLVPRVALLGSLALVAVLALGVAGAAAVHRSPVAAAALGGAAAAESAAITGAAPAVDPAPSSSSSSASAEPPPSAVAPPRSLARSSSGGRPTLRANARCSPPYTWDPSGTKHYKPECL